jgi:hypothetical protein
MINFKEKKARDEGRKKGMDFPVYNYSLDNEEKT